MSLFSRLREAKKKAVTKAQDVYKEHREERDELKQIYREELKKAKISLVKKKARSKKKAIIKEARANAGGKTRRVLKAMKEHRKKRLKKSENNNNNNIPPMFR